MAFLNDISVQWNLSPRIVRVAEPTEDVSLQDLHDTLTELEARPENIVYPRIIESTGKQDLGGGTLVGITSQLLDAKIAFNARKTSTVTGSITSTDVTGRVLTDISASFVTAGVQPGAWIVNATDKSVCSVLVVQDENNLLTDYLGDGVTNQFTSGDEYKLWNVIQMNVAGGNLVAVNSASINMDSILPTMGTQVVRTSAASATLQELEEIQYSSFNGGVTFSETSIYDGTTYPVGTPRAPVNNTLDAITIMTSRGFTKFFWRGHVEIDSGLNYTGITFVGDGYTHSSVDVTSEANVTRCTFNLCSISGTLDGRSHLNECEIEKLLYAEGAIHDCELEAPLLSDVDPYTVKLSGVHAAYFVNCYSGARTHSGEPRHSHPIIDCGGSGSALVMSDYSGDLRLTNKTGGDYVNIGLDAGCLFIDPTVVSGNIKVTGVGNVINESTSSTLVVDTSCLVSPQSVANSVWSTSLSGSLSGSVGFQLNVIEGAISVVRNALVAATSSVAGLTSTASSIKTMLTQPSGFFDGMFVQVMGLSGSATRQIESYVSTSGTIDVSSDPLPFTPTANDSVFILAQHTLNIKGGFG